MKSITRLLLLFPALIALSCTDRETAEITVPSGTLTLTPAVADAVPTKSQITVAENKISDASVALYHDGSLFRSAYVTDLSSAMTFEYVRLGDDYTVYAAFNCGEFTFPAQESDLSSLNVSWDASTIDTKGFPMTWTGNVTFGSDGQNVSMEAVRMVSKVTFSIDNANLTDHNGAFTASSVTLKNSVRTAAVFDADIYGGDASLSSDSATSSDITSANAGGKVSFYTFENLGSAVGGVYVGGSDPWSKVPDNMSGKGDYCTYLEVTGTYSTDGGTCTVPVTYKMYIGENAVNNFDLVRNYIYDVTLCPSDEGIDATSWKVTKGSFTDSRSLAFNPSSVTMNLNGSTTFTVTPYPSDMVYSVTPGTGWSGSTLSLTATGNPNEYSLSSSGTLSADATTSVVATSWDGRVTASLPVTVKAKTLKHITISPATVYKYTGEIQTYTVTATYDMGGVESEEDVTSQTTYKVAEVEGTGVVTMDGNVATAVNGGKAVITVEFGGKTSTSEFYTRYPVSAAVKLTDSTIPEGGSTTASTEVTYSGDGAKKTYTTATGLTYTLSGLSPSYYATISGNVITGIHHGEVSVKATYSEAGHEVTSTLRELHIAQVTYSLSINQGSSIQIGMKVYSLTCSLKTYWDSAVHSTEDVTNSATWTENSFGSIVTVDNGSNKGQIQGKGYGTATVTATCSGQSASISVEVVKPEFELMAETHDATPGNYNSYIIIYVMKIDPFSGKKEAYTTVQTDCTYSGASVTKDSYGACVNFCPGGIPPEEDQSATFTATYTGDAGGGVKYGTQSVTGTCYFKMNP